MSCLFNSMSKFLNFSSDHIRQSICDYLEANEPIVDGLPTEFILSLDDKNYVRKMRNQSEWGGAIEIQAACNIWEIRIIIHNIRDRDSKTIEFLPLHKPYRYTAELSWNGYHYEPMRGYLN